MQRLVLFVGYRNEDREQCSWPVPTQRNTMYSHHITFKLVAISIVAAVCLLASALVLGLVAERKSLHEEAQSEIGQTWGASQTVVGPVLVFTQPSQSDTAVPLEQYVLPQSLKVDTILMPEVRSRGIYDTVVYTEKLKVSGVFNLDTIDEQLLKVVGYV